MYADIIIFSIEKTITDKHRGKNAVEISDAKELPIEKTVDKKCAADRCGCWRGHCVPGPGSASAARKGVRGLLV